jgi:5-methylcytosine-specific restriction endonuclease McrA
MVRHKQHFCDRVCKDAYEQGPNKWNWKGGTVPYDYGPNWGTQAKKARQRDDYMCQSCQERQQVGARAFHVHHIIPFREFGYIRGENKNYLDANALPNLITLCSLCHSMVERGEAAIIPAGT